MPASHQGISSVRAALFIAAMVLMLTFASWSLIPGRDEEMHISAEPPLAPEEIAAVEETYRPRFIFSSGERTLPAPVEYFLSHCRLVGPSGATLDDPSMSDLEGQHAGAVLDHTGGTVADAGATAEYEQDKDSAPPTVYARTFESEGKVIIQYWLFYVFNQGPYNSHEGDWEMVQVVLDREGLVPSSLVLSRHHSGKIVTWSDLRSGDLSGTHPVVLVARGSHAHYLLSNVGREGGDVADGAGTVLSPDGYAMVSIDGGPAPWLRFPGTWGERTGAGSLLGTDGPVGPMFRESGRMWSGSWGW